MKKVFLFVLVLISFTKAQNINPDGYIGGLSIKVKVYDNYLEDSKFSITKNDYKHTASFMIDVKVPLSQIFTVGLFFNNESSQYVLKGLAGRMNNYKMGLEISYYIKKIF